MAIHHAPPPLLEIVDFQPSDAFAFRSLNHAWIQKYFRLEASDHKALDHPIDYIIEPGGAILMARFKGETVGTCALIKANDKCYELAKMAVDPAAQGLGIGYRLGQAILDRAWAMGAEKVFLVSNTVLAPAIHLYEKLGFVEVPLLPEEEEYERADIRMERGGEMIE